MSTCTCSASALACAFLVACSSFGAAPSDGDGGVVEVADANDAAALPTSDGRATTCGPAAFLCDDFERSELPGPTGWTEVREGGQMAIEAGPEGRRLALHLSGANDESAQLRLVRPMGIHGRVLLTIALRFTLVGAADGSGPPTSVTDLVLVRVNELMADTRFYVNSAARPAMSFDCTNCSDVDAELPVSAQSGTHDLVVTALFGALASSTFRLDEKPVETRPIGYPEIPEGAQLTVRIGADHQSGRQGELRVFYEKIEIALTAVN